jgi:hemolysin D
MHHPLGTPARVPYSTFDDIDDAAPSPTTRATLYVIGALIVILLVWSCVGKLDIIASAEGRLVPQTFIKIVQPADAGVVREILVKEGQHVDAGEVLARLDSKLSDADAKNLQIDIQNRKLQLRRIDAELAGRPIEKEAEDSDALFLQIEAQYRARRQRYLDMRAEERETLRRAEHERTAAQAVLVKLEQTLPMRARQAEAYADLGQRGFAGTLMVQEKQREYLEHVQDQKAQVATVASLDAAILQSRRRLDEIDSEYRSTLQNERVEMLAQYQKLEQEWKKHQHKASQLELRAPQRGIIKDLATHTKGTVVTPGTILLTLVPYGEPLLAEVHVKNDDVGFVHRDQPVKVKLLAYPFQKYGMLSGKVVHVGPDAQEGGDQQRQSSDTGGVATYKLLVALERQHLDVAGQAFKLVPGMQAIAEVNQGQRTVMEYLLSPVQRVVHDSARER